MSDDFVTSHYRPYGWTFYEVIKNSLHLEQLFMHAFYNLYAAQRCLLCGNKS